MNESVESGDVTDLPPDPPRWPTVIGALSIAWAVLLIGCAGCGTAFQFAGASILGAKADQFPPMTPSPLMLAFVVGGILLDCVLIAAGVVTIMRNPVGRTLHLAWAIAALLTVPLGVYLQLDAQVAVRQWVIDHPDTEYAKLVGQGGSLGEMLGIAIGVLIGVAYPLWCLIWFGAVKRTAEAMTGRSASFAA